MTEQPFRGRAWIEVPGLFMELKPGQVMRQVAGGDAMEPSHPGVQTDMIGVDVLQVIDAPLALPFAAVQDGMLEP